MTAISTSRLYYQNLCTMTTFYAFQVAAGAVSMATAPAPVVYPYRSGSVTVETRGTYTAPGEANYVLEITTVVTGDFATTRWRWSDTGGPPWNAENLTPVADAWVLLSHGVEVRFVLPPGAVLPYFVLGDFWLMRLLRPYGIAQALDGNRHTEYRSGVLPVGSTLQLGFDFGSAQQPGIVILDDHNFRSTDTLTLQADASTVFDVAPNYSQALPYRANRLAALVSTSAYRYWWLRVVIGGTELSYGRVSGLWLGPGTTFVQPPAIGYSDPTRLLAGADLGRLAHAPISRIWATRTPSFTWERASTATNQDGPRLEAAWTYAKTHASYQMPPFWFLLHDDDVNTIQLYAWDGDLQKTHVFLERFTYVVQWVEMLRMAVL